MAERPRDLARRTGMRKWAGVAALTLPLALAGCGDGGPREAAGSPPSTPSGSIPACAAKADGPPTEVDADLDGDGAVEPVTYRGPSTDCPNESSLAVVMSGAEVRAPVADELPVARGDLEVVQIPGRAGELLLVTPQHPRGGFRARLFGYADGKLDELRVDGRPVFPFVATDVTSTPLSARCVPGGFEVTGAKAHEPIGVVPAWDVFRTTYAVEGNAVTMADRKEIADNVLEPRLSRDYAALIKHHLFENCLVAR